jgi:hypothetical protein
VTSVRGALRHDEHPAATRAKGNEREPAVPLDWREPGLSEHAVQLSSRVDPEPVLPLVEFPGVCGRSVRTFVALRPIVVGVSLPLGTRTLTRIAQYSESMHEL